jgi:hypothetical protein
VRQDRPNRERLGLRRSLVAVGLLLASVSLAALARAGASSVARVGPREIGLDDFVRRIRLLAPFQRDDLGATWPEQRRRFLDQVLIPETLLELQVRSGGVPAADEALAQSLLAELRREVASSIVRDDEIAAYYERQRRHYETPEGILLWRILVASEAEARELIRALSVPTTAAFRKLARERSLDQPTAMRGGSLGYVEADGQTHMPEVRVAPVLYAAARAVHDGELVPQPVPEGTAFAVIWRRGSRPLQRPAPADVSVAIREALLEARFGARRQTLLSSLRAAALGTYRPELLAGFDPPIPSDGRERRLPSGTPPLRSVELLPRETDRGLR